LNKNKGYKISADLYLSVTGATTHYEGVKPHFWIAFKERGKPAAT